MVLRKTWQLSLRFRRNEKGYPGSIYEMVAFWVYLLSVKLIRRLHNISIQGKQLPKQHFTTKDVLKGPSLLEP